MNMNAQQLSLLELRAPCLPEGFCYRPELLSREEESELAMRFGELPLREFEFHGYLGKRRVISYGLRYDFADSKLHMAEPIPDFLLPLRDRAAAFASLDPGAIEHALVTEYCPGAAIGWHRDRPVYGDVIGISFLSACRFRFRRSLADRRALPAPYPSMGEGRGGGERTARSASRRSRSGDHTLPKPPPSRGRAVAWERLAVTLEPRSAYLLRGAARHEWQHSIPPAEELRYSVTLRTIDQTANLRSRD